MKLATALPLIKIALDALDRATPNLPLAIGALREIAGATPEPVASASNQLEAVSIGEAARRLGYSTRHVRSLIRRGALGDAVIGSGRSTRIVVSRALEALRDGVVASEPADAVEKEFRAWRRRESMHVVGGSK